MGFDAVLNYGFCAKEEVTTLPPRIPDEFKSLKTLRGYEIGETIMNFSEESNVMLDDIINGIENDEDYMDYLKSDKMYPFTSDEEENILFNKFLKWYSHEFQSIPYYLQYCCSW
jgi:hypothetical protein